MKCLSREGYVFPGTFPSEAERKQRVRENRELAGWGFFILRGNAAARAEELQSLLTKENWDGRHEVAGALSSIGPAGRHVIIQAVDRDQGSSDADIRFSAISMLIGLTLAGGALPDEDFPRIRRFCEDGDARVRQSAIFALGLIKEIKAEALALLKSISDAGRDPDQRFARIAIERSANPEDWGTSDGRAGVQ